MVTARTFEVRRDDHASTRLHTAELGDPQAGQVVLAVDHVALTANNVTYAVTGDSLDYWSFHPAEQGWGRIPAMGHATVVASAADGVEVGTRTYGWYPLADHVLLEVEATSGGFRDVGAHRAEHAEVYRRHSATDRDPLHQPEQEERHALLRGLFLTAWVADDLLADRYPELATTVVTSASSKTGIGVAQCRARRDGRVVGVTSARNVGFVEDLGLHDQVVTYDDVGDLTGDGPAAVVDVAGDRSTLAAIHEALADDLVHSMAVGRSHWEAERHVEVPPPRPEFLFAPTQLARRTEQWGAAELGRRTAAALHDFVAGSQAWLDVERSTTPDELAATYAAVRAGEASPATGHVVSLR